MRKITAAIMIDEGRKDENKKRILQAIKQGILSIENIAELFEVTVDYIKSIE
jgi:hypothetical protein